MSAAESEPIDVSGGVTLNRMATAVLAMTAVLSLIVPKTGEGVMGVFVFLYWNWVWAILVTAVALVTVVVLVCGSVAITVGLFNLFLKYP